MLPILLQNVITMFVSLLDNIMVGQVGTEQMSGVAIANQILFIFNLCIFGGISGVGIFSAQYYGKQDHDGKQQAEHAHAELHRQSAYTEPLATLHAPGHDGVQRSLHDRCHHDGARQDRYHKDRCHHDHTSPHYTPRHAADDRILGERVPDPYHENERQYQREQEQHAQLGRQHYYQAAER